MSDHRREQGSRLNGRTHAEIEAVAKASVTKLSTQGSSQACAKMSTRK
jgi:hypothetical protein